MNIREGSRYFRNNELKLVKEPSFNTKVKKFSKRLTLHLLIICIVGAAAYYLWLQIRKDDSFKVARIEISGCRFADSKLIADQLKGLKGENLFDVDIDKVTELVKRNLWVKNCTTVRKVPETIGIYIEEHKPVAIANVAGRYFIVAKEGDVIDLYNSSLSGVYLPVINLSEESKNSSARYKISLSSRLLERIRAAYPQFFSIISEVIVARNLEIGIVLNNDNNVLLINSDDDGGSLKKYFGLYREIKGKYPEGLIVDLRFKRQVILKPYSERL